MKYIAALDQGTTSSRAVIYDENRKIVGVSQKEFTQYFPKEGWVEHDAEEIYETQISVLHDAVKKSGISAEDIAAIGITNQRETTVVWDKRTGKPVANAIVWQCRRTADLCEKICSQPGVTEKIREKTGLVPDAYFSATKIRWILDNVEGLEIENLLFGTIDTWLVWKMTCGKVHVTDYTNASRTMLFNIKEVKWDRELLELFGVPESMLPEARSSSEVYGRYNINGVEIPISGIAGDQQAALFGQTCFEKGQAKNTYGTGCFLLMNTGEECRITENGLITTIGIGLKDKINYAIEGSVFIGGAVVQWLRDGLKIIDKSSECEAKAESLPDNGGVYFVPAFTGLGAPHWDMNARGGIFGLTRGTTREHIIRAAVESMAFQTMDLLSAMEEGSGTKVSSLRVDGGAAADNFLLQFQADVSETEVVRPENIETTSLGAAMLAGLAVGLWPGLEVFKDTGEIDREFRPETDRKAEIAEWKKAVERVKTR